MTIELEPVDRTQCQALKPNGNTFMTLGGKPGFVRCKEPPVAVATEKEVGKDGLRGSMSLCIRCLSLNCTKWITN